MKPLTPAEWWFIVTLLTAVNHAPDTVDLDHLKRTAADNARLAGQRETQNARD